MLSRLADSQTRRLADSQTRRLKTIAVLVVMGVGGISCGGDEPAPAERAPGSVSQAVLTDVIPDSLLCNRDSVKPSWCISAPPASVRKPSERSRFVVDGKGGNEEYLGGIKVGYTNWEVKATGSIYAKVWRYQPGIVPAPPFGATNNHLQILLENIPFYSKDVGELCIFVDNNRFTGPTPQGGGEDRVYCVDMMHGTETKVYRPRVLLNQVSLQRVTLLGEPVATKVRSCYPDPSTNSVLRCNAELSVSLPNSAFEQPAPTLDAGIGLAVIATARSGGVSRGSMPEQVTEFAPPVAPWADRRGALTLLFGPPKGFAESYMSWNTRRSKIAKLAGDFDVVDDADVGRFLAGYLPWGSAPHDIVAIQEGWNQDRMKNVLAAANDWRKMQGLAPFNAYGPVDFESTAFQKVVAMIAGPFIGNEGTTGGLWIYSPLPDGGKAFHSFKACRGEDCFKAKGIQWVRLMLNPPSSVNTDKTCLEFDDVPCPPPPSGDDYVDVFNVHMQSDDPELCSNDSLSTDTKDLLKSLVTDPNLTDALNVLKDLAGNGWNCGTSDSKIREQQLVEMREFIDSHAVNPVTLTQDRPAIIMGDFNINGRTLGEEYQWMIQELGVGPYILGAGQEPTDVMSRWPDDFDWDVDHGDIARERKEIDFSTGMCSGTFIGSDSGTPVTGCDYAGNWNGNSRYDYILVRPPSVSDAATAAWVAGKKDGDDPGMWFSPFPSFGAHGVPPERLSDHKPVTATIEHVKLVHPPLYHATWNHDVAFRVSAADGSNHGDCTWCGPVDPKILRSALRLHNGVNEWRMVKEWGGVCQDLSIVSWPGDSCMMYWTYSDSQIFGEDAVHTFFAALYDDDSSSNDEPLYTFSGDEWPQQAIEWDPGWVRMRGYKDPNRSCGQKPDWPIEDSFPIPQSTGSSPTAMTLLCSFAEMPPGKQQ